MFFVTRSRNISQQQLNVVRRVYQQETLNKDADYKLPEKTVGERVKKVVRSCGFGACLKNSIPIVKWLPKYSCKNYMLGDLIAGATTAVMHIPQGMAYALLAEVPPIVGLYMAFFPVLIYVMLGTSPHVSMVMGLGADEEMMYSPLQVVSVVCLLVGIFQVMMWTLRLGAVSTLLSEPLVSGFTTAASFHVLASQLKDLFGVKLVKLPPNYKVIATFIEVCKNLPNLNWAAFVISFITCLIIALNNERLKPWVSKRSRVPVPIELLAIVIGTLASRFGHLRETYGISLVGHIPTGLPTPTVPPLELMPDIAIDCFTITMVTYTISMSMALIFASKDKYEVDANQELLALGASNMFASFFGCSPFCASLSRSYIQYQQDGYNVDSERDADPVRAAVDRAVLRAAAALRARLHHRRLAQGQFWVLSKLDALVWLVTFLVTLCINIDIGLGAGLLASLGALFIRSQNPYTCLLGKAEELPGIKIFHYCGGLNFATKNLFRKKLFEKIGYMKPAEVAHDEDNNLTKSESYEWDPTLSNRVQCVIVDVTALSYVDGPGIKSLVAAQKELVSNNINVLLAGANGPVLEMIDRYNSIETDILQMETFPTVHDAVLFYKYLESKKHVTVTVTT
ncbi:hypothetical protein SFRURICE_012725 [Spodoptera frugiperda]|nr:hypothetical protein SFRURICE_012725 [Spodoptera frugiperda]